MKKIILSLVFVLAFGSNLTNANNVKNEKVKIYSDYCDEVYENTRNIIHAYTGSLYINTSAAIAAEEACLEQEEELMVAP